MTSQQQQQQGGGGGGGGDPWAWLGLLKWSLNYVDGTVDHSDATPMSAEDRAFLEQVMKEGIIDENERMKFILQESTKMIEYYKNNNDDHDDNESNNGGGVDPPMSTDDFQDLLEELRDIVEQIDYARAFCSLKGLPFVLGCISTDEQTTTTKIPTVIKSLFLGILSTLAQNNPHVQKELLELGACKILTDVYFHQNSTSSSSFKAKIMQAMSSMIRNNDMAEQVFVHLPQAPTLILEGLSRNDDDNNNNNNNNQSLQTKTLFFLKALLTADQSTSQRVLLFQSAIIYIVDEYLLLNNSNDNNNNNNDNTISSELIEMAISLLEQLIGRQLLPMALLEETSSSSSSSSVSTGNRKDALVAKAVQRISQIRSITDPEEKEFAQYELEHWENFLVVLARGGGEGASANAAGTK